MWKNYWLLLMNFYLVFMNVTDIGRVYHDVKSAAKLG